VSAQDRSQDDFEAIIVDNGSRDDTARVAGEWLATAAHGRYLIEPRVGLAHARNAGIRVATADIVAFLDDDVVPDTDWITRTLDAYRRHPSCAAVGGRISLDWGTSRPGWMRRDLERWYSGFDLGHDEKILEPPEALFGANLSVRRALVERAGGFDPTLGRAGRSLLSGEEAALIERLRDWGDIVYDPDLHVTHAVLPERRNRLWLLRRGYAQGRTDVRRGREAGPASLLMLQSISDLRRLRSNGLPDVVHRAQLVGRARELILHR
jgi:GT2 family glycosyltransferase